MKIMPNRMDRGFFAYQEEFEQKALAVLRSGWYVLGKEVAAFEENFAAYVGSKYCVGVASGLDALYLAFRALGIGAGDEVIVQGNTYIASVMGITMNGATPVFVEPDEYYGLDASKTEAAITDKTKAILVVHLYGQPCQMDEIKKIAKRHGLKLVEDCAQSHGASFAGRMTGSFGDIGCFSFYPSKNLGAFGDGGAITTDDEQIAAQIRMLRNYGSEKRYYNKVVGVNSRLDELQAGLLSVRLSHMEELTKEKQHIAALYDKLLKPKDGLFEVPKRRENATHVFHQYVIKVRDKVTREKLIAYLDERQIGTIIHYPIPPHLSEAYAYLGFEIGSFPIAEDDADRVLSIPMYNGMTEEEQAVVIGALNAFSGS
ncbi:MAG: DegT/DnrJ/EryC1/StrS family aminotransferase [Lachnospiraceae bacterium]|nr:DegT/DnrJ/EryC1/StrS family aminotransferase [Lachnospiraceae bacterium]